MKSIFRNHQIETNIAVFSIILTYKIGNKWQAHNQYFNLWSLKCNTIQLLSCKSINSIVKINLLIFKTQFFELLPSFSNTFNSHNCLITINQSAKHSLMCKRHKTRWVFKETKYVLRFKKIRLLRIKNEIILTDNYVEYVYARIHPK